MDSVYLVKVNSCATCGKLARYNVPINGYSHVQASLDFSSNELARNSLIAEIEVKAMSEVSSIPILINPVIEKQSSLVFVTLDMAELDDKNIIRVFVKLLNNSAQPRAHHFFRLFKV